MSQLRKHPGGVNFARNETRQLSYQLFLRFGQYLQPELRRQRIVKGRKPVVERASQLVVRHRRVHSPVGSSTPIDWSGDAPANTVSRPGRPLRWPTHPTRRPSCLGASDLRPPNRADGVGPPTPSAVNLTRIAHGSLRCRYCHGFGNPFPRQRLLVPISARSSASAQARVSSRSER